MIPGILLPSVLSQRWIRQPSRQHRCLLLAVLKQSFSHPSVCVSPGARLFGTSHFPDAVILPDSRALRWGLIPACRREVCRRASKRIWVPGLTPFLRDRSCCRWSPPPLPTEGNSRHWETHEGGFALQKPPIGSVSDPPPPPGQPFCQLPPPLSPTPQWHFPLPGLNMHMLKSGLDVEQHLLLAPIGP